MAAVALLPLVLDLKDAQIVIAIPMVIVCAATFLATWRHFCWREGRWLVIGAGVGVPIGFWALGVFLGAAAPDNRSACCWCVLSASELCRGRRAPLRIPPALSFPIGVVSGCLGGALNIGGPPAIAYAYSQPWSKEQTVSLLQVVFGISAVPRLGLLIPSRLIQFEHVSISLVALAPMLLATWCGSGLLKRLPGEKVKIAVFVFSLRDGREISFLQSPDIRSRLP